MGFVVGLLIVINLCFAVAVINLRIDLTREQNWSSHLSDTSQTWMESSDKRVLENAELRKKLLQSQRDAEDIKRTLGKRDAELSNVRELLDTEKQINVDHQQKIVEQDSALVRYRDFYNAINAAMRNRRGIA